MRNVLNRQDFRGGVRGLGQLAFVACLLSLGGLVSTGIAADEKESKSKSSAKTLAVFEFNGTVTDKPMSDDPLFGAVGVESLQSLLKRVKEAGEDDNIGGLVLIVNSPAMGVAQVEEFQEVLSEVRKQKPVYGHADSLTTGSYLLLSGASRVSVTPTGDVWVNGLYGEEMYLRGLFDMVGVQPQFLTCGKYKSAAEMFTRKEASPEAEEMMNWLFDSMYDTVQTIIADGRKVEKTQAHEWLDHGLYTAESAKEAGLIDAVETREDLLAYLKSEHGAGIKLDKKYGKKSGPEIDLNSPFGAMQLWAEILSGPKQTRSTKNAIAIVHVDGPIMLGRPQASILGAVEAAYSEQIRKALDEVAAEPRIRAVVLRVNSPGGSATASEIILQAAMNVQSSKPVVVSMGSVAGSGGYYVACRGDRIFADASTITGSIGVVGGKLATEGMWNRIGVNFDSIERGKHAGLLRSGELWTKEDQELIQNWMDEIYGVFKSHVEEGRGDKLTKPIDELAGGRVFSGQQALELGLIDEIGTLNDAIAFAAEKADLEDYEIRTYPKAENFLDQLIAELGGPKKDDEKRLSLGLWSQLEPVVRGIDPVRVKMLQEALMQLEHLNTEHVMLTMPVIRLMEK